MLINKKISVHLQNFPNISFLDDENKLISDMDVVRDICSAVLSIRDEKNLRVRLPLNSLTVVGKNSQRILSFSEIIADEVNVKKVFTKEEIEEFAEIKLQINFKKIGAKYGSKVKEITSAIKKGEWQKISEKEIKIAGVSLVEDEFELKFSAKNYDEKKMAIAALPTNDYLVLLDTVITKELENEGIARDIIRAIQQNRKDCGLDISDQIDLEIFSSKSRILEVLNDFGKYISDQVLANSVSILSQKPSFENFQENKIEDGDLFVAIKRCG